MLKRLSYPMESITSFSRILTSSPKSFVDFSGSLFYGRGSEEEVVKEEIKEEQEMLAQEQKEQKEPGVVGYRNLVEEKPEIFETFDSTYLSYLFSCLKLFNCRKCMIIYSYEELLSYSIES